LTRPGLASGDRGFADLGDLRLRLFEHDSRPSPSDGLARGITLVLLHGAGANYLQWPHALRRLPGMRVFAPDLPGHGDSSGQACADTASYARVIRRLLDKLDVTKCVVAGYSMGGGIALELAYQDPEKVVGLGVLGAGERIPIPADVLKLLDDKDRKVADGVIHAAIGMDVGGRTEDGGGDSSNVEGVARRLELIRNASRRTDPALLAQDLATSAAFDARPYAGDIRAPTLIVAGEKDMLVPVSVCRALHHRMTNSELHVLEGAGHMFLWERTQEVAGLMRRLAGQAHSFADTQTHLTMNKVNKTNG